MAKIKPEPLEADRSTEIDHTVESDDSTRQRSSGSKVTPRAFLIGLFFALLICAVLPYNDYYIGATFLSGNFLPVGSIFAIVLLSLVANPILIAFKRRERIFTPAEIITVWAMVVTVAGIPSSGLMRYLIPHLVGPYYYASSSNGWADLILSHVPRDLFVTDPNAVSTFFKGLRPGQPVPWHAWFVPLSRWSIFVFLLYGLFFSLAAILRRQWVENERLGFPLVRLPLFISESPEPGRYLNSLFRSPLLWTAVLLVTCLHTVKGLHTLYPIVPDIPTTFPAKAYLTAVPWSSIGDTTISIYPLIIGVAYLLSTEVCFSLWFFYLLFRLQTLVGAMYAWDLTQAGGINMGAGFIGYQEAGGAVALAFWLLWSMRAHLKMVLRKALTNDPAIDDTRESLSYRAAVIGFVVTIIGLFLWMVYIAKVVPTMAIVVLFGGLCIFLMLSWLVAQAGLFFAQQSFSPTQIATTLAGTGTFNASTLMMASYTEQIGWYDARELMMPSLLNSYKASQDSNLSSRSLTRALAVCVMLAVVVSAASTIWLPYTHGGASALPDTWSYVSSPQIPLNWTETQINSTPLPSSGVLPNMVGGAIFVLSLIAIRASVTSFCLHPAGFLIAATYPMFAMWFSLMVGDFLKAPIVHYGGMKLYRTALPFFMGLILGDCLNAIAWTIIGLITKTGYHLLPT